MRKNNSVPAAVTAGEDKKKRRKALTKLGILTVLAFIVWIFSTIAWFAMNDNVGAGGMGVGVAGQPFELASTGAAPQDYLDLFGKADTSYSEGTPHGVENNGISERRTGTAQKLIMRLDSEDDGNSYTAGLRPGASGVLNFDIVPNIDDAFYVKCNFNLRTFVATYNEQTGALLSISEINSNSSADLYTASNYLRGHILFFEDWDEDDEVYSGFLGSDGYTVTVPANSSGTNIPVTIYWKWVNTFDQMLLTSTDNGDDVPLFDDENATDREAVVSYINTNYQNILADISNQNAALISDLTTDSISEINGTGWHELNENYNTADQIIGVSIDYFLLDISAEQTSAPRSS